MANTMEKLMQAMADAPVASTIQGHQPHFQTQRYSNQAGLEILSLVQGSQRISQVGGVPYISRGGVFTAGIGNLNLSPEPVVRPENNRSRRPSIRYRRDFLLSHSESKECQSMPTPLLDKLMDFPELKRKPNYTQWPEIPLELPPPFFYTPKATHKEQRQTTRRQRSKTSESPVFNWDPTKLKWIPN